MWCAYDDAVVDPRDAAQALVHLFALIQERSGSEHLAWLEGEGLSLTQYKALSVLSRTAPAPPRSVKDLAATLNLSGAATSRAVDGLVRRGLLDRAEDARDRRQRLLRVTEPGRQVVRHLDAIRLAGWQAFVEELDPPAAAALYEAILPILAVTTDRA